MLLNVTNPIHPKYETTTVPREPAASSSAEGITNTLANAPMFTDIAEDV
jgi:predicted dinucleotide-binding enzyme